MPFEPQHRFLMLLTGLLGVAWGASLHAQQPAGDFEVLWEFDARG